jgi:hypothetical protein
MSSRTREGLSPAFLDMAMCIVCVLLAMMLISVFQDPKPAEGAVTPKAEFLVEMTWDDGSTDDVDLYARGPDGKVVFFGNRTTGLMFLDRDNLGSNNTVATATGTLELKDRREIVTIRALAPGEYVFNSFCHRCTRTNAVKLRVVKLNPYAVVAAAETTLDQQGQERTMVAMTVDANGTASPYAAQVKMVGR